MNKLPKEIYEQLNVKKQKPLKAIVKITFYKNQAVVHFPSVMTSELDLKPKDSFELTVEKSDPPIIICKLLRGKK